MNTTMKSFNSDLTNTIIERHFRSKDNQKSPLRGTTPNRNPSANQKKVRKNSYNLTSGEVKSLNRSTIEGR